MKIQGRVKKLMPVQSGISQIGNSWKKQEFIVEYYEKPEDTWADSMILFVMNDDIEHYKLQEGEEVEVEVRHRVDSYNNRVYNRLTVRSLSKLKAVEQEAETPEAPAPTPEPEPTAEQKAAMEALSNLGEGNKDESDDLPF